jgi:chromosome segregation ATPase
MIVLLFVLELSFTKLHNVLSGEVNERETPMSTDTTQNLPNGPSFEERVFARFDALDAHIASMLERQERMEARQERMEARQEIVEARLDRMEARLERMEARLDRMEARLDEMDRRLQVLEEKAYDTKPIWERAVAEILELREDVHTLDRKFNIVTRDLITLRAEQTRLEDRMDKIESKPV